jgi:DNA repair protein NreA
MKRVKFKDIEQIPYLKVNKNFKQQFQGSSPAPFIGRYNYPNVNIGFLSPQFSGDTSYYDSPQLWSKSNFKIGMIAGMRYGLVNSRTKGNVYKLNQNRILEVCQEVGMAKKAVELEVSLNKPPQLSLKPEKEIMPFGPSSQVNKARITSNPQVDSRVERVVYDTDLKAAPAIISLYKKGFEESFLNKLLSVGNTGLKRNRKLVPTRWSITAVDDTVGKELIKEVKNYQPGDYQVHFGGGWGNYYLILFFPEVWSYELFEMYLGYKINPWSKENNFYSTDYENYKGRKSYAEECAGGYYANRLSILEKMKRNKRQQSSLVLRFITPEYNVPLGVWVCREATRKSLNEKPLSFASEELMLKYAKELVKRKLGFDINELLIKSKLLKEKSQQKKLSEF